VEDTDFRELGRQLLAEFGSMHQRISRFADKALRGGVAAMRLIRPDFKISCEHGQFTEKGGILFTALYHPSALLRDETKRPDTFSDLKALQSKVREVCTRTL